MKVENGVLVLEVAKTYNGATILTPKSVAFLRGYNWDELRDVDKKWVGIMITGNVKMNNEQNDKFDEELVYTEEEIKLIEADYELHKDSPKYKKWLEGYQMSPMLKENDIQEWCYMVSELLIGYRFDNFSDIDGFWLCDTPDEFNESKEYYAYKEFPEITKIEFIK